MSFVNVTCPGTGADCAVNVDVIYNVTAPAMNPLT
jgi:hypothetical protein